MANNYHFFNPGRLSRDQNTLLFEPKEGTKKYLPIADVSAIYIHGHLDVNSALLQFLGKAGIPIYFFNVRFGKKVVDNEQKKVGWE